MFASIRTRILAACLAIVVAALLANAALNYFVAKSYNDETITANLDAVSAGHVAGINDWIATRSQMIKSLQTSASSSDPLPSLLDVMHAGNFSNVYVGRSDKTAKFSAPEGIPADYDPTTRPWYKEVIDKGNPLVSKPFIDAGTGKLVISFAAPTAEVEDVKGGRRRQCQPGNCKRECQLDPSHAGKLWHAARWQRQHYRVFRL